MQAPLTSSKLLLLGIAGGALWFSGCGPLFPLDEVNEEVAAAGGFGGTGGTFTGATAGSANAGGGASGNPSAGAGGAQGVDGTSPSYEWARWPMPNPPASHLPTPSSYNTSVAGAVFDEVTVLWWQQATAPSSYTLAEAKNYCAGLELAAYSDWRLPTYVELVSLVDFTKTSPAIDGVAFPGTLSEQFWTASAKQGGSGNWVVDFYDGQSSSQNEILPLRVRCVRPVHSQNEIPR